MFALTPPDTVSLSANAEFQNEAVAEMRTLVDIVRQAPAHIQFSGLLLTGSFARGEGAIASTPFRHTRWLSDIECLAVLPDRRRADFARARQFLADAVRLANDESNRRARGIKIEITPIMASRLGAMRPAIFTRELVDHGKLLWGEPAQVPMPPRASCDCLRIDALRLLNNRIIETLALRAGCSGDPDAQPSKSYLLSKFWVELGTSLSVFLGCYRSTYRGRQAALESALTGPPSDLDPDTVRLLSDRLKPATEIKLGRFDLEGEIRDDYETVARAAQHLWCWETGQLLGDGTQPTGDWPDTAQRLRRIEGIKARARDWARLALRTGLLTNVHIQSFGDLLRAGSFANAIYTSGCLLFFYWNDIGLGTASGKAITRTVCRLFDVSTAAQPSTRRLLAVGTYRAWQSHLRSAAA
jgi:hypothetical protein